MRAVLPLTLLCYSVYQGLMQIASVRCNICERLEIEDNVDCRITHPVYQITCVLCNQIYSGESSTSLNERLSEHWRFASNPNKPSYKEEALAVYYREHHHNIKLNLKFKLLYYTIYSVRNTIMRKIHEAFVINNLKPQINDKEECISVKRFLVINLINNFSVVFVFYAYINDVHIHSINLISFQSCVYND